MIAENPANSKNLVAGGLYQEPSAFNDTRTYLVSGVSGAATSWDSGRTWSTQVLPPSPDWTNSTSPQCGHFHLADTDIVFGPNNTVYYVDLSYPGGGFNVTCTGPSASTGLYVTRSTDGGTTWETPVGIAGTAAGGSVDKPWAAVDQTTGYVYVAYTDDANSSQIFFQRSTDRGVSWSTPLNISAGAPTSGSLRGVELVVDPGGGVNAEWIDQSSAAIEFTRSTDHGLNFTPPKIIAVALSEFTSPSPDAFRAYTLPGMGVEEYANQSDSGRLFVIWQNGSGGTAGSPAITLTWSADNGSTWSNSVSVASNKSLMDFQPDVTAGPDGAVYAEWYGVNATNGLYRLYGAISHDGGASFGAQYAVSDVDSNPQFVGAAGNAWWIGDYTHVLADSHGARALWTDARSTLDWACLSPCLWGYVYNISFYTAEMTSATVSASVPISLGVGGSAPLGASVGPAPSYGGWLVGENYTLSAPLDVTVGTGTEHFALWYGTTLTNNATLRANVSDPVVLRACYVANAGTPCREPGAPGRLHVHVAPATATVSANGIPFTVDRSTGIGESWENDGNYTVRANLPGYYPVSARISVSPGNISYANLTLQRIPGHLRGLVSPVVAVVSVSPLANVTQNVSGSFGAALVPGAYTVSAALYGYTTERANVTVVINRTVWTNFTLRPLFGWINGSVIPSTASVSLNGVPVSVDSHGRFALQRLPGTFWLNGTAPGYRFASTGPFQLLPLGHLAPRLWLPSATGIVVGTVFPPGASVWVGGNPVVLSSGSFNVSLLPGNYTVEAASPGFSPWSGSVVVVYNRTSPPLSIQLAVAPGWIAALVYPTDAVVLVDGSPVVVSTAGTFNISTAAGNHTVSASSPGYRELRESVYLPPGRTDALNLTLSPVAAAAGTSVLGIEIGVVVGLVLLAVVQLLVPRLRGRRAAP
ncbi:MAG: hypothetical protein L3K13_03035 [Thermoplasmata archaeon]|nr:hypothetical protein [Thermoplasmata archaeon]